MSISFVILGFGENAIHFLLGICGRYLGRIHKLAGAFFSSFVCVVNLKENPFVSCIEVQLKAFILL